MALDFIVIYKKKLPSSLFDAIKRIHPERTQVLG